MVKKRKEKKNGQEMGGVEELRFRRRWRRGGDGGGEGGGEGGGNRDLPST